MKPPFRFVGLALRRARFALAMIVAVAVASGAEKNPEPMRGVDRGQPAPPIATLVIGINEAAGGVAEPGWPLIISATRLADPNAPATALPSDLNLKVNRENGTVVELPLTPVPRPPGDDAAKSLHWLAAETATAALAPGRYRLAAAALPAGWRVESGGFQIVAPNPERSALLGQLRIKRAVVLGRTDDALAEADRTIAANDQDQAAWIAKGDLLLAKDQPDEALLAYDRALALRKKTDREPLAILARRRSATQRSLEKRGVIAPK